MRRVRPAMVSIHVIGIGLDGAIGLTAAARQAADSATLLVGSDRHLAYFPRHAATKIPLADFHDTLRQIHAYVSTTAASDRPQPAIAVLTSGDPLFFGLGRLLLSEFPADWLTFHPHLSAIQLAFSRIKVPWQDARLVSAHGRSPDTLIQALQQGAAKIAALTDGHNTPPAIARLVCELDLPGQYHLWVCENLGGAEERVRQFSPADLAAQEDTQFAPLNVVILLRDAETDAPDLATLPILGIPDSAFLSFGDRPGLMTKRDVRMLALAELALQPEQVVWDIGAGTGSVSIEAARLCPTSTIYALEKTAAGFSLVQQNAERFQVKNLKPMQGKAPDALSALPAPDRVFIGGSGGQLGEILDHCAAVLKPSGRIVLAIATLDHLAIAQTWLQANSSTWQQHALQVNLARTVPVAALTRFAPLNPVTLITLQRKDRAPIPG
ncbi:MAG: bifunctional cobalt-precorrin-7 (C(5))-methyltransferase/cobalt-precorrin-6B (C(15))-methyltransferase [Elainellaceae cyanobacterium]